VYGNKRGGRLHRQFVLHATQSPPASSPGKFPKLPTLRERRRGIALRDGLWPTRDHNGTCRRVSASPFHAPSFHVPSRSVPSSRHFDVCDSVADNDRVARARAPLSSVQPPVWSPLLSLLLLSLSLSLSLSVSPVLTLLAWRACAPRRHAVHHRETERASSPLPRQFTSTKPQPPSSPTPLCPGGGVAIRIKRPIHGGRSISFLVATGEIC